MSAEPGHPSLRAVIARALSAKLSNSSQREVGDHLGVAGTTIGRRGDELAQWPATDLLKLAVGDSSLGDAIVAYLRGEVPALGQAVSVVGDLHLLLGDSGKLISEVGQVLQDGRVDEAEARHLRVTVSAAIAHLQTLTRDLDAVVRG